ncbi:response regulator [Paracidovorax anthurii]|uniref:CheY-like chemotaxis protein n=1 Tax=Paracidovorax anthurii TaxID=78229 RepID=A0A328ZBE6_9BURK|nr:response regulator [Paracidovorax anthurii]RAR83199.1 CheY-like chemotaxis protein [Paracidovorax anthurii]
MSPGRTLARQPLLLVEPQFVLRRTIVAVARELELVEFHEATSIERAVPLLGARTFSGLVIDCDDNAIASDLLSRLREGAFASPPQTPVIAITSVHEPDRDAWRQSMGVIGTLHKPFKIGALLERVQAMLGTPRP